MRSIITKHSIAETSKKKLKILLSEDNPVNQKVALIHLRKFGYVADVANNGLEALAAVKKRHYDLVLMDVQMPEMDGLQAVRIIRDKSSGVLNHHVPVIALTADATPENRSLCLESGMDDYLAKPVLPEELNRMIDRHLNKAKRMP
jgi:CheY-like chemotaxis protein